MITLQQKLVLYASINSLERILLMTFRLMDCERKIDVLQSEINGLHQTHDKVFGTSPIK